MPETNAESDNSEKRKVTIRLDTVPGPDFTTYDKKGYEEVLPREFQRTLDQAAVQSSGENTKRYSHSFPALTKYTNGELYGRALACSAYGGTFWSITLRCDEQNTRPRQEGYEASVRSRLSEYVRMVYETAAKPRGRVKLRDVLGYCPQGYSKYSELVINEPAPSPPAGQQSHKEIFLNEIYPLCDQLYDLLFAGGEPGAPVSGLLAITGTTDSSKSLITRGLIFLHLERAAQRAWERGQRKPHLVTFEDPIEQYFVKNPLAKTAPDNLTDLKSLLDSLYVDYTPREKEMDADNLKQVTKDALRQTPAILFVGETRERSDWKDLLEFAGSGHLVITTSHASSVVEAMTGIFRDTDTKTPAQRSEIARRILGIINIRSFRPQPIRESAAGAKGEGTKSGQGEPASVRALLPALWKNTSQSKNNLIADGLASLLPALGREPEIGYYSRTHFARELTEPSLMTEEIQKHADRCKLLVKDIKRKAREWDIEGV